MKLVERVEQKVDKVEERVNQLSRFRWIVIGCTAALVTVMEAPDMIKDMLTSRADSVSMVAVDSRMNEHSRSRLYQRASYRLDKFKKVKNGLYNFRCPYCGDSQKHKNKARGYFFMIKQRMVYKCHNCGIGRTCANFLKEIAPEVYSEYQLEKYRQGRTGKGSTVEEIVLPDSKPRFTNRAQDLKKISDLNNEHPAKQYLLNRQIPEEQLGRFYYADRFKRWVNSHKANVRFITK